MKLMPALTVLGLSTGLWVAAMQFLPSASARPAPRRNISAIGDRPQIVEAPEQNGDRPQIVPLPLLFGDSPQLPTPTAPTLFGDRPRLPTPSPAQLAWQRMEMNAFVHFGPNTFSGEEWGTGQEDPGTFNPTYFDARQWARTFKDAGFGGVIITAKHHDGFCLWPSKLSTHTVAASPWRDGDGDVLAELAAACRDVGLKLGLYLSPWDRNHPTYGTPEYNRVFAGMLEEVLTGYGPIFEVWFDGANGEGPNGKRQVYDWPLFVSTVRQFQPEAVIFSDAGPDIRWVGNERGEAPLTVWSTIDRDRYEPGTPLSHELGEGSRYGRDWVPAECDVSIRPGWFFRAEEDRRVKSASRLFGLYEASVGRNCTLLLNVPPDQRGLLTQTDVEALRGMRALIDRAYGTDLGDAAAVAGSTAASDSGAELAFDGSLDTHWMPDASDPTPTLTARWSAPREFDRVVLQEAITLGQRIAGFIVEAEVDGTWRRIATGSTVGHKRILVVPATKATALRISVEDRTAAPAIAEVTLHRAGG